MNEFQRKICKTYGRGDYAYIADPDNAPNWRHLSESAGDTLFTFLMLELSTEEDCDTVETARRRLDTAQADIQACIKALGAL